MAYNKAFNPDALPAHAQPDEAAAAIGRLELREKQKRHPLPSQQKPLPRPQQPPQASYHQQQHPPRDDSYSNRRPSPAAYQQAQPQPQQSYGPPLQTQSYAHYNTGYGPPPSDDPRYNVHSPPPPADYGAGPRPQPPSTGWRTPTHQPPRQTFPQLPPNPEDDLDALFRAANISHTGALTTTELGSALVNADFTPFDPTTIKSLVRMFSTTPANAPTGPLITPPEFQNLWKFLAAWKELFERFDSDNSGKVSFQEFSRALNEFGYKLSPAFVHLLFSTFNERSGGRAEGLSFDLFVQACVSLKRMTDVFKGYDTDRDGYVTLSFEEFLSEILKLRET